MQIIDPIGFSEFTMETGCVSKVPRQKLANITSLDENQLSLLIPVTASGAELFVAVITRLKILEADYFDLDFIDIDGSRQWIDHTKPLNRQLNVNKDLKFRLCVKFYVPHPNILEEEYTRYLFALQIKKDLLLGTLPCSDNTAALLGSYLVQAEIGDFFVDEYRDTSYLTNLKIIHDPNESKLERIRDFHQNHVGMSPADADFNLLETARKVEMYGVHLYPSRETVEFFFDERENCKNFWKRCIEHHAFFRLAHNHVPNMNSQGQAKVVSRGSTYRYIGRTQKELTDFVRNHTSKRATFKRLGNKPRYVSSILSSGNSYANTLGRKFASASMTLRTKSMDRKTFEKTNSYQDSFHTIAGLKRSVSPDMKTIPTVAENEELILINEKEQALPSGYSTMPGSSGEGQLSAAESGVRGISEQEDTGVSLRESSADEDKSHRSSLHHLTQKPSIDQIDSEAEISRQLQATVDKLTAQLEDGGPQRALSTPHLLLMPNNSGFKPAMSATINIPKLEAFRTTTPDVQLAASTPHLEAVNPLFFEDANRAAQAQGYAKMADLLSPKVDAMHLIDSARYQQLQQQVLLENHKQSLSASVSQQQLLLNSREKPKPHPNIFGNANNVSIQTALSTSKQRLLEIENSQINSQDTKLRSQLSSGGSKNTLMNNEDLKRHVTAEEPSNNQSKNPTEKIKKTHHHFTHCKQQLQRYLQGISHSIPSGVNLTGFLPLSSKDKKSSRRSKKSANQSEHVIEHQKPTELVPPPLVLPVVQQQFPMKNTQVTQQQLATLQQLYTMTGNQPQQFLYRGQDGYVYAFPVSMIAAASPTAIQQPNYAILQQQSLVPVPTQVQEEPQPTISPAPPSVTSHNIHKNIHHNPQPVSEEIKPTKVKKHRHKTLGTTTSTTQSTHQHKCSHHHRNIKHQHRHDDDVTGADSTISQHQHRNHRRNRTEDSETHSSGHQHLCAKHKARAATRQNQDVKEEVRCPTTGHHHRYTKTSTPMDRETRAQLERDTIEALKRELRSVGASSTKELHQHHPNDIEMQEPKVEPNEDEQRVSRRKTKRRHHHNGSSEQELDLSRYSSTSGSMSAAASSNSRTAKRTHSYRRSMHRGIDSGLEEDSSQRSRSVVPALISDNTRESAERGEQERMDLESIIERELAKQAELAAKLIEARQKTEALLREEEERQHKIRSSSKHRHRRHHHHHRKYRSSSRETTEEHKGSCGEEGRASSSSRSHKSHRHSQKKHHKHKHHSHSRKHKHGSKSSTSERPSSITMARDLDEKMDDELIFENKDAFNHPGDEEIPESPKSPPPLLGIFVNNIKERHQVHQQQIEEETLCEIIEGSTFHDEQVCQIEPIIEISPKELSMEADESLLKSEQLESLIGPLSEDLIQEKNEAYFGIVENKEELILSEEKPNTAEECVIEENEDESSDILLFNEKEVKSNSVNLEQDATISETRVTSEGNLSASTVSSSEPSADEGSEEIEPFPPPPPVEMPSCVQELIGSNATGTGSAFVSVTLRRLGDLREEPEETIGELSDAEYEAVGPLIQSPEVKVASAIVETTLISTSMSNEEQEDSLSLFSQSEE